MAIGNTLFTELATRGFARVQTDIADLQGLISSGKNDPRASADQMRAAQLSAFREQLAAVEHFTGASDQAASRIDLADKAIGDASVIMRRLQELSLYAGNDTLPEAGLNGLKAEATTLRASLVEIANRVDALGQPLFSGYSAAPAFEVTPDGVIYLGDEGRPAQRLSETLTLPVGINGAELFGASNTDSGRKSVFGIVDDLIASFGNEVYAARSEFSVMGSAKLRLNADRSEKDFTMTISGPLGKAEVTAAVVAGLPQPMIDAINAQSTETGVTAALAENGDGIVLSADGELRIADLARSDDPNGVIGSFQQLAFRGQQELQPVLLKTADMSQTIMLGKVQVATDHFAEKQAEVGAMGATIDQQIQALDQRRLNIDEAIAGLEDLDVAAAVTKLQSLLLTRDASQQTFVKITRTTLFDYLR